jgi:AraC-like DNA-binding protein
MRFFSFTLDKSMLFYKGGEFVSHKPWRHKPMYHKGDYELIICIKGPIHIAVEQQRFSLQEHDVLVLPPFTHFHGFEDSKQGIDFYWFHFFTRQREATIDGRPEQILADLSTRDSEHQQIVLPMYFRLPDDKQSLVLIHQILSVHADIAYVDERDFLTSALLIKLFKAFASQHTSDESAKINYIKEWIRANITSTLTVAEIADSVHLNPDYLTRLFKKYTGMTTLQYLNHLKLEVASLLLVRTEMPIKQIAGESYFNDSKIFTRKFKSETGLSPTEYRNCYNMIHHNNPHVDPQIPVPKRIEDTIDYIPENGDLPSHSV